MLNAMALLSAGTSLSRGNAESVMEGMIDGVYAPEQIAEFLVMLRDKGESVEEIVGFLNCLGKRALPAGVEQTALNGLMDVCGTGGDASGTFNVSTTVAFVVAAAGQRIAKHGNRSVSSRSGSFDVLEALGLSFEADPLRISRSIEEFGIGLYFAPAFHPSFKALAGIRKSVKGHTIFNALGPLLNPARVKRQLIGVYNQGLLKKMAEVLLERGAEEAMVVRGDDGLDELSLSGPTQVAHLKAGAIRIYTVRPEDCGLTSAPLSALMGGDARENAQILIAILRGERGPKRDIVLLNSAAALMVGGKASDLKEGVAQAGAAIDSGMAFQLIRRMGAKV